MSEDSMHADQNDTAPESADETGTAATEPHDGAAAVAGDTTPGETVPGSATHVTDALPDLDAMAADLDGVDAALERLAEGTYWSDEITGEPIPDAVLAADPMARRA